MSRASARSFTRAAKAASISSPLLALRTWTCSPISGAAAFTSFTVLSALSTLLGFTSTPMRAVLGKSSRRIPSLFFVSSAEKKLIPVALLSGRERLATRPSLTGSSPTPNTIGIVVVGFRSERCGSAGRGDDNAHTTMDQIVRQFRQSMVLTFRPTVLDRHIPALDKTGFTEASPKCGQPVCLFASERDAEKSNHRHRRLLRARHERPRGCPA